MAEEELNVATDIEVQHKNRFFRFTPTVSMGQLASAFFIVFSSGMAWMHLNGQITELGNENVRRIAEIASINSEAKEDRAKIYQKIADDHAETKTDIRDAQSKTHEDIEVLGKQIDRMEDRLDKKVDKK